MTEVKGLLSEPTARRKGGVKEDNGTDYDISSYPAKAESDEEVDMITTDASEELPNTIHKASGEARKTDTDDILCIVCAEVLVDPCTLHCGHSFCQLCLASVWKRKTLVSAANLHCPLCRQPWGSYPGINIQLRNIIERSHGKLVELRRANVSDADTAMLSQYVLAKEKQRTRRQPSGALERVLAHWPFFLLALVVCGTLVVLMATAVVMLVLSGAGGEFMRKPVSRWNNDDVMAWVGGLGNWATQNVSLTFLDEKISGAQLLLLDRNTLKSIGIHVEFHIQSLLLAIHQLQQEDRSRPRNFQEFMAAHRKQTVLIGVLYKLWPRMTFFYVYVFEYYDVFLPVWYCTVSNQQLAEEDLTINQEPSSLQLLVYCLEILLVPHYLVGMCAWCWYNTHMWLSMAIVVHCLWSTQQEANLAVSHISTHNMNWKQDLSALGRMVCGSLFQFLLALICGFLVWPFVPYFLCDWLFYALAWNTALMLAFKAQQQLTSRRQQRPRRQDGA